MAKRFIASEIWGEDWFLDMPTDYKLFWYYMITNCDHAGVFRVNLRSYRRLSGVELEASKVLEYFNFEKGRIRVISDSAWFIEDFFVFQYGSIINLNNSVHYSIVEIYKKHNIDPFSIRGLKDLKEKTKDKDKDIEKDIDSLNQKNKNGKPFGNFKAQSEELFAKRTTR